MNAERFTFYIKNPAHLYQITYTELKSLVLLYPYCQNLRYLLLKKSIQENHQESERNLQLAATYSADRNFLYQQIKGGDSYISEADSFLLKKDYLELKELQPESASTDGEFVDPIKEIKPESGDRNTDNMPKVLMDASETIFTLPPIQEMIPKKEAFIDLEDIEEDEMIDITNEMEEIFVTEVAESPEFKTDPNPEANEHKISDKNNEETTHKDEAISIEELIKLDSLSPLERMEKLKNVQKPKKKDKKDKKEDHKSIVKKKKPDFEKIDKLIEKTKKEVPLEITNKDILNVKEGKSSNPSPKSSFSSWLKQFQPAEEKTDEEETFVIPESKIEEPTRKKDKKKIKKIKKTAKKKKRKAAIDAIDKKKAKKIDKAPLDKIELTPEKPKEIAAKSLTQNSEIVSETLAGLLVKQENYKQAIKMYEKLSLIFPEKSGFFADQIKNLKNL